MINRFLELFNDVCLSPKKGTFLADKSYKYDTVFYLSNFILKNNEENIFDKKKNKEKCINFIESTFSLKRGSTAAINYLTEVLNLLQFSNIIKKIDQDHYLVNKEEELKFISERVENAYIFLFIITYSTFKNEGILNLYFKYIEQPDLKIKNFYLDRLFESITKKSKRISDPNSVWGKLNVKYPLMVLGLFYKDKAISKNLNITDHYITVKSLSINVNGTKTEAGTTRNNDYIFNFDLSYIDEELKIFKK